MNDKYKQAQELRNQGKTLKEITAITGIPRWTLSSNTKPYPKTLNTKPVREGNRDKLYKGEVKLKLSDKVFQTIKGRDNGKTLVQVRKNTWIYTSKPEDKAILEFEHKYKDCL